MGTILCPYVDVFFFCYYDHHWWGSFLVVVRSGFMGADYISTTTLSKHTIDRSPRLLGKGLSPPATHRLSGRIVSKWFFFLFSFFVQGKWVAGTQGWHAVGWKTPWSVPQQPNFWPTYKISILPLVGSCNFVEKKKQSLITHNQAWKTRKFFCFPA